MKNDDHLLGNMTLSKFLEEYWQQKPLLIPNAIRDYSCPISADELAGLACEPEVESRIILEQGESPWQCMHGPFEESLFSQLPETLWTLLIQSCNLHIEAFAQLLERFHFIPNWRVDDVMVSYAAPGGSVGPHTDNYDVFLLQAQGVRRWSISTQESLEKDFIPELDLRILKSFEAEKTWELEAGDMLYLPPGVAHHGVAHEDDLDDCITISIGFRAPNYTELSTALLDEILSQHAEKNDSTFYRDPKIPIQENCGEISDWAVQRLNRIVQQEISTIIKDSDWVGKFLTSSVLQVDEPSESTQSITPEQCFQLLAEGNQLVRNETSKLAFIHKSKDRIHFFCNGNVSYLPIGLLEIVSIVCNNRYPSTTLLIDALDTDAAKIFLCDLLNRGYFFCR